MVLKLLRAARGGACQTSSRPPHLLTPPAMPRRAIAPGPRQIPSGDMLRAASELNILTEDGRAVPFGSLFENGKTLAVFNRTRHPSIASSPSYACSLQVIFGVLSALFSVLCSLTGLTGT